MKIPFTNLEVLPKVQLNAPAPLIFGRQKKYRLPFEDYKNVTINTETYYNLYKSNGDIWACAREWAENVGSNGWELIDSTDAEAEVPELAIEQLQELFKRSGGFDRVKGDIVRDLAITGDSFLALVSSKGDTLHSLERIDPRTVVIVSDEHGKIHAYLQKITGHKAVVYKPEEVIHFKGQTDFDNPLLGMSPMHAIVMEVLTDNEATMTNYAFFKNNAQPAAQYIMDETLSEEAMDAALDFLADQLKGSENNGKAIAMQGVKEVKVLSETRRDMEFLEGRKFATDKICSAYGVPKFILGYTDSVNNNNGTELLKKFYLGTIQPKEMYIEEVLTEQLVQMMFGGNKIAFKFLPQAFDEQKDIEERAQRELAIGAITRRQYKKKTGQEISEDDEKIENFDSYIILQGMGATLLEDIGLSFDDQLFEDEEPAKE